MKELLTSLYGALGPQVTSLAAKQFGLSEEKAGQVLPTVAPALFSEIKNKAESPAQNAGLLKEVMGFLQDAPPPAEAGGTASSSLVEGLLGNQMGGLVGTLSQQLGLSQPNAKSMLMTVVPMILAFLKQRSGDGGIADMLGPILGEGSQGKLKMLEQLMQGGSALGGLGKLAGGLFGR